MSAAWAWRGGLPLALLGVFFAAPPAQAKLRVVTTIETLAALTREVGGGRVEAQSLSHGYEDPHFVQAKPSLIVALNRADAVVYVGLELEVGWLPPLVLQSRNAKIQQGQPGNIDCSAGIKVEDVPNVPADKLRALGDIHPLGNPHYWIPPPNALGIARLLATRLGQLDPAGAADYRAHLADFEQRLAARSAEWEKRAAGLRGIKVVSYHRSWSYVAGWLGMQEMGYIEPKPGVPPSTQHTADLITLMRKEGVRLVLEESFYPRNLAQLVAEKSGARLAILPSDVGAAPQIKTYFDLVDAVLAKLLE
jgi:zinc/manganese transport system substrate-binding protein